MWAFYDLIQGSPLSFKDGSLIVHNDQSSRNIHNNIFTESYKIGPCGKYSVVIRAESLNPSIDNFSIILFAYFKDQHDNLIIEHLDSNPEGIKLERFNFSNEKEVSQQEIEIPQGVQRIAFNIFLSQDIKPNIAIHEINLESGEFDISLLDQEVYFGRNKIVNPNAQKISPTLGNLNSSSGVRGLLGRFIGINGNIPTETSSILDISKYSCIEDYIGEVRKVSRKGAIYPARLAGRRGYRTRPFFRNCHLDDYLEINDSSEIRQGKPMSESYRSTSDRWKVYNIESASERLERNKKNFPSGAEIFEQYKGSKDWGMHYGVFIDSEGHNQGDFIVDEKLVGYLYVSRFGEIIAYSYILGHSDHLRNGIMYKLHFDFLEMIISGTNENFEGVKYVFYAGHYQGEIRNGIKTWGLRKWKEKLLFEPTNLQTGQINKDQCHISILMPLADSLNLEYEDEGDLIDVLISENLIK